MFQSWNVAFMDLRSSTSDRIREGYLICDVVSTRLTSLTSIWGSRLFWVLLRMMELDASMGS